MLNFSVPTLEPRRSPFDFDGDGKTDISIFRPSGAEWWINKSSDGSTYAAQFGASTDNVTPADFTGDGKTDIAIWRPSTGEWFVLRSEDSSFFSFPFGTNGDIPAPADYDADGQADAAVFRPSTSTWTMVLVHEPPEPASDRTADEVASASRYGTPPPSRSMSSRNARTRVASVRRGSFGSLRDVPTMA